MAKEVIEFDKPISSEDAGRRTVAEQILETGDQYFELLSSKVRLAKLGLFILEVTEEDEKLANTAMNRITIAAISPTCLTVSPRLTIGSPSMRYSPPRANGPTIMPANS